MTISLCHECARQQNIEYARRLGGAFHPSLCEICGEEKYLEEHRLPKVKYIIDN